MEWRVIGNPEKVFIAVPPGMVLAIEQLATDYAAAIGESAADVRRLVEIAVLARGVRMLREQVEAERKHAERMGWV